MGQVRSDDDVDASTMLEACDESVLQFLPCVSRVTTREPQVSIQSTHRDYPEYRPFRRCNTECENARFVRLHARRDAAAASNAAAYHKVLRSSAHTQNFEELCAVNTPMEKSRSRST